MSIAELLIIAVGLSMDAFAVAVCKGLSLRQLKWKHSLIVGLYFGGFQAAMPVFGYLLGYQFKDQITRWDHWIAFFLLLFIGAGMIKESLERGEESCDPSLSVHSMTLLAVATSIDALAVGVSFAFFNVRIVPASILIGVTTFLLSVAGVRTGHVFGARWKSRAELTGGVILILMGVKILAEHLEVI